MQWSNARAGSATNSWELGAPEIRVYFLDDAGMLEQMRNGMTRAPKVALAVAVVALVTSLVAVIVVIRRSSPPPAVAAPVLIEQHVTALAVLGLRSDAVENVTESGKVLGVRVRDEATRKALGIAPGDVITAISGRTIDRESDVGSAVRMMGFMEMSTVYIDILRDEQPVLLRWKLDVDLRTARKGAASLDPFAPSHTGSGSNGIRNPFDPDPPAPDDPLLLTIRKLDDLHYAMPRATFDQLIANLTGFMKGARIVPSMKNGVPDGLKLYAIRPVSVWNKVGFMNGDAILRINGLSVDTLEKAIELYPKIKDGKSLLFDIRRRGREATIAITFD